VKNVGKGKAVAFNNMGPLTLLRPGAQAYWWYVRSNGADFGTQFASADVLPGAGQHLADLQTKEMGPGGGTTYHVRITNQGSVDAWHNLQGGGMS
jgi:hypothetical protein